MIVQHLRCLLISCTVGFTLLQLATIVEGGHGGPVIDSVNVTQVVDVGSTVVLECVVEDPEGNDVQWWRVDHGLQISNNKQILTHSWNHDERYKILTVEGGEYRHWNLRIFPVRANDSGLYECRIANTNEELVDRIIVQNGDVVERPTNLDRVDFTECCVKHNVSQACLPVCNPQSVNLDTFDPTNCGADLLKLLKCGADGRNHVSCCRHREVPSLCVGFCINSPPSQITSAHAVCLTMADRIIQCFEEGHHLLPSPPQSLRTHALSANSLYVKWNPPADSFGNLTGYRVFYRQENFKAYRSTDLIKETHFTVSALNASKTYDVYVVSIGAHGSSLPSYIERVQTLPSNVFVPDASSESYTDCCKKQGVSEECQQALCTGQPMQANGQSVAHCFSDMDKVFKCIALERNHTNCCQARGLPSSCLPICRGELQHPTVSSLSCFTIHMPDIISCFDEGRDSLPGPPSDVVLSAVKSDSAILSWDPPVSNPAKVQAYLVSYGQGFRPRNIVQISTKNSSVKLDGLMPSHRYFVRVASVNSVGSSLPSPDIVFLTYTPSGKAWYKDPLRVNSTGPQSLQECCQTVKVKDSCRAMCAYDADFASMGVEAVIACEQDLGKVILCAAAGRNHTMCCAERGLPSLCYPFCAFDQHNLETFSFDYEHIPCVFRSTDILQCMQEGIAKIPSYPESVTIVNYTAYTISVAWHKPSIVPPSGLVAYVVRYQLTSQPLDQWQMVRLNTSRESYIIQNLQPDKGYRIQVLAASNEGYSLPENMIYSVTLPVKEQPPALLPNLNFTSPGDMRQCCLKEGVTAECLPACDGQTSVHIEHTCANQLDKLLRCSADGRDHRPCCQRSQVPQECLSFCMGDVNVAHFVSMICLSFSQEILTCFHEGFPTLPSPPQDFHLVDTGIERLIFAWSKPRVHGEKATYDLFFKVKADTHYTKKDNVTSQYTLGGLNPFTEYEVFVISENSYGNSRPSSIIEVWTLSENMPTINVWQIPDGNLKENDAVSLTCDAGPDIRIYWVHKGKVIQSPIVNIESVDKTHTGRYTCIADSGEGRRVAKDLFLHVVYAPEATAVKSVVSVEPNRGLTAQLRCEFHGFPEHVSWRKGGSEITPAFSEAYRFLRRRWTREEDGVIEAMLEIQAVQVEDYANYFCKGSNKFGEDQDIVHLTNPNPQGHVPTIKPAPKQANVTACCIENGVSGVCMPACTFDIDLTAIQSLTDSYVCFGDLRHLVKCAADGRNHSKCCRSRQVPRVCHGFCAGVADNLNDDHISCLSYIDSIVDCMELGADVIPTPPQNLKGQVTQDGFIKLWWEPPLKNPEKVQMYRVFQISIDGTRETDLDRTETHVMLKSIHSHTLYTLHVTAHNHHGSSQSSNIISLHTQQFNPSSPRHLSGNLVSFVHIRLSWDTPGRHPGAVTRYNIHYRRGNATWFNVTTKYAETTYRLNKLQPNVKYQIYVTALSSTVESSRSNIIIVSTMSSPRRPGTAEELSGNKKVAIGIGVAISLCFLVILAVLAFWFCRVRKAPAQHGEFKESVSFENPGYATATEGRVGLPTFQQDLQPSSNGKQPVHDVGYGYKEPAIMKEAEAHSDQGYSTMSGPLVAPPISDQLDSSATLDVTQLDPVDAANIEHVSTGM